MYPNSIDFGLKYKIPILVLRGPSMYYLGKWTFSALNSKACNVKTRPLGGSGDLLSRYFIEL